jgi:hypothetical protein
LRKKDERVKLWKINVERKKVERQQKREEFINARGAGRLIYDLNLILI